MRPDGSWLRFVCATIVALYALADAAAGAHGEREAPKPNVELCSAVVAAGGGADFKTTVLLSVLAGSNANSEVSELVKQFSARAIKESVVIFDFAVSDGQRLLKRRHFAFPGAAVPDPKDGRALSAALYEAGRDASTRTYDTNVAFDTLLSHPVRLSVDRDIDERYGRARRFMYKRVLDTFMRYLKLAYAL